METTNKNNIDNSNNTNINSNLSTAKQDSDNIVNNDTSTMDKNENNNNNNNKDNDSTVTDNNNNGKNNDNITNVDSKMETLDEDEELSLQFRWTLYYSAPKGKVAAEQKKWVTDRAKEIIEFGTVADFWRVFNNLISPSQLKDGSDFHLFRSGVKPQWEDTFNQKGGAWTYRIPKDDDTRLDTSWFNTVLTMIGDNFDDADDICGIVISKRSKTNRIQLWTKHADDSEAVRRIGKKFKEINRIKKSMKIYYYSHDDAKDHTKPSKNSEMII